MSSDHNKSIGIFDSGVGGLTVLKQLMAYLPDEHFVYFADTARMPYGEKSSHTVIRYSIDNAIFLMEQNIKMLVIACNTASAFAKEKLQKIFPIPVLDVIGPGAERAVQMTRNGRIAVLGTKGTTNSGVYKNEIQKINPDTTVFSIACPLLAPLVEEKFFFHPATRLILKEYISPYLNQGIDTVLLGCTHYPLLKNIIQEEWGPHVIVVDSATNCAEKARTIMHDKKLNRSSIDKPNHQFFVSDDPAKFRAIGEDFLGSHLPDVTLANANLTI